MRTVDMTIHTVHWCEQPDGHEAVDITYYCQRAHMFDHLNLELGFSVRSELGAMGESAGTVNDADGGSVNFGAWPGGAETDYDVYCALESCGTLLWVGLDSQE